jgi:ABC-type bacteriocin/lantibiotic exporter with double-glycine peptidase domain
MNWFFGIVAYLALLLFMVLNLISLMWVIVLHIGLIAILIMFALGFLKSKSDEIKDRKRENQ